MAANRLLPDHLRVPAAAPEPPAEEDIGKDTIYGVEAIRDFLGLRCDKQVYRLREHGRAPIFKVEGVGLAASKKALRAYYQRLQDAANDRAAKLASRAGKS